MTIHKASWVPTQSNYKETDEQCIAHQYKQNKNSVQCMYSAITHTDYVSHGYSNFPLIYILDMIIHHLVCETSLLLELFKLTPQLTFEVLGGFLVRRRHFQSLQLGKKLAVIRFVVLLNLW